MRTTRALLAGLGTTGSMVAAAACVFLVAGAVIAFNGWPGAGFTNSINDLFVDDAPPVAWDQPGTATVATSADVAAAAVTATPAGPTFGAPGVGLGDDGTAQAGGGPVRLPNGTIVPGGTTSGGGGGGGGGSGPGSGLPSAPGAPGVPSVGDVQSGVGDTVGNTGSGAGGVVRDTTGSVGDTVGGPAGDTIKQTGSTLGDTVEGAGGAAGDLVGGK
jgi:hypothetical protein